MRKRYYIDALNKSTFGITYYDACSKPRSDAEKTANALGFESISIYSSRLSKLGKPIWKKVLLHAYNLGWQAYVLWQARSLGKIKDSDILIQYGFSTEAMFSVVRHLKRNGNRIIMLIHDYDSFRLYNEGKDTSSYLKTIHRNEKELLNYVDVIIAHSKPMETRLREMGFKGAVKILRFFDYLNDYETLNIKNDLKENIDIVFAGNLEKSTFIQKLDKLPQFPNVRYFLYGKHIENIPESESVIYKGCFKNDDIAGIEGTWGLVWDGESTDKCRGVFGEYLKINAPFKFSLYLAKGLPVIVWKQSAMAYYVEKYGLGITINSLNDIYNTIQNLTTEEIQNIKNNIQNFSTQVKTGKMLTEVLEND